MVEDGKRTAQSPCRLPLATHDAAIPDKVNEASDVAFRRRPVIATLLRHRYRLLAVPRSALRLAVNTFDENCQLPPSHDILAVPAEQLRDVMNRFAG